MRHSAFTLLGLWMVLGAMLSGCAQYGAMIGALAPGQQYENPLAPEPVEAIAGTEHANFCPAPVGEIYMVMPEEGRTGVLAVTPKGGDTLVLSGDYSGAKLAGSDLSAFEGNREFMEEHFGEAIVALPTAPLRMTLYFEFASKRLTASSKQDVMRIVEAAQRENAWEIDLVGHTDTVDSKAVNRALSLRRAEHVRDLLIEQGIPAERISVAGRGEEELRVPTPDETREAENRRVEATIR